MGLSFRSDPVAVLVGCQKYLLQGKIVILAPTTVHHNLSLSSAHLATLTQSHSEPPLTSHALMPSQTSDYPNFPVTYLLDSPPSPTYYLSTSPLISTYYCLYAHSLRGGFPAHSGTLLFYLRLIVAMIPPQ